MALRYMVEGQGSGASGFLRATNLRSGEHKVGSKKKSGEAYNEF
jgi:hypothetical protein